MDILLQQLINGITVCSVYALVALGYTMVYGIIGLINFAHVDVVMVGAMVETTLEVTLIGADPGSITAWLALLAAMLLALPVVMALGWVAESYDNPPLPRPARP